MLEKLEAILDRFAELDRRLAEAGSDFQLMADLSKERSDLEPIANLAREYKANLAKTEETEALINIAEGELLDMANIELDDLQTRQQELETELKGMLIPKDPRDNRNVIVEIRAGTGGDEAGLFVADLLRMYLKYADLHHYKTEIISANETGIGGFKEVTFSVKGRGAFSRFKFESGVHRVQRVPETESQGRVHTSAATVAVLPEAEDVEVEIDPGDLRVDVYRSGGHGGQSVNTTDSAVRITHLPSGLVVTCQDEKSQLKNKEKAMRVLKSRLLDLMRSQQDSELAAQRKSQVGSGDRSERIRTYNFPQGRVTDHRIGLTLYRLEAFMLGDLDGMIDALAVQERANALKND